MSANISEEVLTSKRQGLSEEERLRERERFSSLSFCSQRAVVLVAVDQGIHFSGRFCHCDYGKFQKLC